MIDLWGNIPTDSCEDIPTKPLGLFDYIKSIRNNNPIDDLSGYDNYIINKAFMQDIDTVVLANMVNMDIPKSVHYLFLSNNITNSNSYAKWAKVNKDKQYDFLIKYYSKREVDDMIYVLPKSIIDDMIKNLKIKERKDARSNK